MDWDHDFFSDLSGDWNCHEINDTPGHRCEKPMVSGTWSTFMVAVSHLCKRLQVIPATLFFPMVRWFHKTMKSIEPVEYEIGCCECMHINCLRHFLLLSLFVVMISNIFPDSWIRYLIRYPLGTHQVGNLPICRRPALQCCISCLKEGPVIGLAWQSLSSTCCGSIGVSL